MNLIGDHFKPHAGLYVPPLEAGSQRDMELALLSTFDNLFSLLRSAQIP